MCASCGCGMVNEDHGDGRHLILSDLELAAEAAGISVQEVIQNLQESASQGDQGEADPVEPWLTEPWPSTPG